MIERRPWTQRLHRQLPLRFRDVLPQPLPPVSPVHSTASSDVRHPPMAANESPEGTSPSLFAHVGSRLRSLSTTSRPLFGLSRRYHAGEMPSYDPEQQISLQDLSNIPDPTDPSHSTSQTFYPYPNLNAFRLGDWFWNGGVQKSQASFRDLMDIVGAPDFQPADVRGVQWDKINTELGAEDEREWMDEDAGWTRTPVTISVPYQPRRGIPSDPHGGPRDYVVGDFYHRSLVSIIREKLSGQDARLFHMEPYELLWHRVNGQDPIRVQGELYTSPAFVDIHRELQESPGEPGCDLPRVIAALMFWSDVTHLTAFGNAKVWPLYLFFGNDSKYRRCKPSCHLCEHVAYFQKVSYLPLLPFPMLTLIIGTTAPGCLQRLRH
jgi:Plavaka transposase